MEYIIFIGVPVIFVIAGLFLYYKEIEGQDIGDDDDDDFFDDPSNFS